MVQILTQALAGHLIWSEAYKFFNLHFPIYKLGIKIGIPQDY